jgi:hypothetical protein
MEDFIRDYEAANQGVGIPLSESPRTLKLIQGVFFNKNNRQDKKDPIENRKENFRGG